MAAPKTITIIASKPDGNHQQELLRAAQNAGLQASIHNLQPSDLRNQVKLKKKLGDGVVWRSSALDLFSERASLLPLLRRRVTANMASFEYPALRYKYFQQQLLRDTAATSKWSIPTYRFASRTALKKALEKGTLTLPLIMKPNAGSRGEGIELLRNMEDVAAVQNIRTAIFQHFIPNDGDWRVVVVGGVPLGVLRRQAEEGGFLNNVSRGATATVEERAEVVSQVTKIATKVASLCKLSFGGIDIIRDQQSGAYYVLEVNTAPQWRDTYGFRDVVGVDVPAEVMGWMADKLQDDLPVQQRVEQYYKSRLKYIPMEAFHFASRLWLWTGDEWARRVLDDKRGEYIGTTETEIRQTIAAMVQARSGKPVTVNQNKAYRQAAFAAYPELPLMNALLFKTVFCDSVYELDIRPYVREHISDAEFLDTFNRLVNDGDAVRLLSTHAVNFFYLLKNYFKGQLSKSTAVLIDPHELIDLLDGYEELVDRQLIDAATSIKLQIYLLTHAILGESRFYARPVRSAAFRALCERIETLISRNYFAVTLDNKCEFLVCAEICGYKTTLRGMILQEAEQSLSWAGNFIVDTRNQHADSPTQHCLGQSEHRNVLYLMACSRFARRQAGRRMVSKTDKLVLGRLARVSLPQHGIRRAVARVDSGATRSSVGASNTYVDGSGKLHYTLLDPAHHLYTGQEIVTADFKTLQVKNATLKSEREPRFAVELPIEVEGYSEQVLCTLADRSAMLYPVLLGRNFLTDRYQVDTSKQFNRPDRRGRKA